MQFEDFDLRESTGEIYSENIKSRFWDERSSGSFATHSKFSMETDTGDHIRRFQSKRFLNSWDDSNPAFQNARFRKPVDHLPSSDEFTGREVKIPLEDLEKWTHPQKSMNHHRIKRETSLYVDHDREETNSKTLLLLKTQRDTRKRKVLKDVSVQEESARKVPDVRWYANGALSKSFPLSYLFLRYKEYFTANESHNTTEGVIKETTIGSASKPKANKILLGRAARDTRKIVKPIKSVTENRCRQNYVEVSLVKF